MAIGPATFVAKNGVTTGASTSLVLTLGAGVTVPTGTLLQVSTYVDGNATVTGVSDSSGNTWSSVEIMNDSGSRMYSSSAIVASSLTTGGTITLTFNTTSGRKYALAIYAANPNTTTPFQGNATFATGTSTTPSVTIGTLAQADTLLIAMLYTANPVVTKTEDPDYTSIDTPVNVDSRLFWVAARTVASTASDTYAPTISASQTWRTNIVAYNGSGSTPPTSGTFKKMTLLGVG